MWYQKSHTKQLKLWFFRVFVPFRIIPSISIIVAHICIFHIRLYIICLGFSFDSPFERVCTNSHTTSHLLIFWIDDTCAFVCGLFLSHSSPSHSQYANIYVCTCASFQPLTIHVTVCWMYNAIAIRPHRQHTNPQKKKKKKIKAVCIWKISLPQFSQLPAYCVMNIVNFHLAFCMWTVLTCKHTKPDIQYSNINQKKAKKKTEENFLKINIEHLTGAW